MCVRIDQSAAPSRQKINHFAPSESWLKRPLFFHALSAHKNKLVFFAIRLRRQSACPRDDRERRGAGDVTGSNGNSAQINASAKQEEKDACQAPQQRPVACRKDRRLQPFRTAPEFMTFLAGSGSGIEGSQYCGRRKQNLLVFWVELRLG